jgi:hypothetical protein
VVLAFVSGYLWALVADPPEALVTPQGVFLTDEVSFDHQVTATLWFLAIGALLGVVAGFVTTVLGRRQGLAVVVGVLAMSAVATLLGAWLGIHVFGPDPESAVQSAQPGDTVTSALEISSAVVYLGWPIGGLAGVLLGLVTWPAEKTQNPAFASSSLPAH